MRGSPLWTVGQLAADGVLDCGGSPKCRGNILKEIIMKGYKKRNCYVCGKEIVVGARDNKAIRFCGSDDIRKNFCICTYWRMLHDTYKKNEKEDKKHGKEKQVKI